MPFFYFSRLITVCLGLCCLVMLKAQQPSVEQQTRIMQLLQQTELLTGKAAYDSATAAGKEALALSVQARYKKGEAFAYDHLSEIMLLNGRMAEVRYYDSLVAPLAVQLNDTLLIINADNRSGVYYMEQGKTKEAEQRFQHALDMRLEKEQSKKTAEVYSNLASLYLAVGEKDRASDWFFKALRLYEKHNSEVGQGETYSNISSVFYLMGRIDDAIDYQKKSILLRERQHDIPGLVITNINIGQLFILKDSFPLAFQHIQQAVTYAESIRNPKLLGSAYTGMFVYYNRTKDYKAALEWQKKAIRIFEETDNKPMLSRLYVAAGILANSTNDSTAAVELFNKALVLAKQLGNKENISNAYEKLSDFYRSRKEYQLAYDNYRQFIVYRDSVKESSTVSQIEEIRTRYETEKKDNEIARLNTEQRIRELEIDKQKAIISGNKLAARQKEDEIKLLSQQQELRDAQIKQQEKELEKQILLARNSEQELQIAEQEKQIKDKQIESQKQVRNLMIGGIVLLALLGFVLFNRYQLKKKLQQQKELLDVRTNIAKDLHDEIGSTLTSIKILSEVSQTNLQKDKDKASTMLNKITEQSSQMQQGMSDIVWAIKPDNDKLENMLIRMREYASHTLESRNIRAIFSVDEKLLSQSLNMQQRRDFFLIFKEAINNAAKYSEATEVNVRLTKTDGQLLLDISDNGIGFDTGRETSSSGLKNMRARAEAMSGSVRIQSQPGRGTTISASVPATS